MSERREFELTDEQYEEIIEASQPVPYMVFNGRAPASPQERANRVWQKLGKELGFRPFTVRAGKSEKFFTAIPVETEDE